MNERELRIARNEALLRDVNERTSELHARWDDDGAFEAPFSVFCECANAKCVEPIHLTRADYESVREHGGRFVVRPGHEVPDVEHIVAASEGHVVVEKVGRARDYVEQLDPRLSRLIRAGPARRTRGGRRSGGSHGSTS